MAPTREVHEGHQTYDIGRIATVFGFEKNGMHFPSHVEITTSRSTVVPGATEGALREATLRRVTQDYSRFEFFSARSRAGIIRFVDGEGPLFAPPATEP